MLTTGLEALARKEFYLLWVTRLSVVMISNVISAYYKAFGQTFIKDDRFLSIIGAITSVFNCSGRLVYGMIMDKFAYKVSMTIEACLLIILMSTFNLTSLIGVSDEAPLCLQNMTENVSYCVEETPPTSLTTKVCGYETFILSSLLMCRLCSLSGSGPYT